LRQYVGGDLKIDVYSGRDYPDNLREYKLIVHCGGCMLTRREMLEFFLKSGFVLKKTIRNYYQAGVDGYYMTFSEKNGNDSLLEL
jgi:hypothetical protein